MSGWLSRAKDALSGRAAETVPEPIQIPCLCGRTIETVRRESFQRVLCKGCGEPFFILPLDVYPRPVMKKVRPVKSPKSPATTKSPVAPKDAAANVRATTTKTAGREPTVEFHHSLQQAAQAVRRQFTSLRLIVLSLSMVLGLTGWWQWNRAALSRAEGDYTAALAAGEAALEKKDLINAASEFERAANAVNLLQRTDIAAEHARQRHRELTAINSLMQSSLQELLDSAHRTMQKSDPAAAASDFAHLHAGRWIVLQSEINCSSAADTAAATWEQRVQVDDVVLLLTASLPAFSKIPAAPTTPASETAEQPDNSNAKLNDETAAAAGRREIIFAAQVQSIRWSAEKSQWELTLNPATGFLWSDYGLLVAAGLVPDELRTEAQLRSMLLEQSRWIGVAQ